MGPVDERRMEAKLLEIRGLVTAGGSPRQLRCAVTLRELEGIGLFRGMPSVTGLRRDATQRARAGRRRVPAAPVAGLNDAMFHMIRQNAAGGAAVLIRMLGVLTAVAGYERDPVRRQSLRRHADLVLTAGKASFKTGAALTDLRERHARVVRGDPFDL